jgi:hypothetical protein
LILGSVFEDFGFVAVYLEVPRLGVRGPVRFMVDTGSQTSFFAPRDASALGIVHARDFSGAPTSVSTGIGGAAEEFQEGVFLTFVHTDRTPELIGLRRFGILLPTSATENLPSILGLDVLRYFRLTFEPRSRLLQLEEPA